MLLRRMLKSIIEINKAKKLNKYAIFTENRYFNYIRLL